MIGSLGNVCCNSLFSELLIKVSPEGKGFKDIGKLSCIIANMNAPFPYHTISHVLTYEPDPNRGL